MKTSLLLTIIFGCMTTIVAADPLKYNIDPEHALPHFAFNHLGYSTVTGRFDRVNGTILYDPKTSTASVDITIDMNSVNTGVEVLDKHLRSGDFFDVRSNPEARFKSTFVEFDNGRPISITGDLTLNGVTKSVTFMVTSFKRGPHAIKANRDALGGNARAVISRTDFGLGRFTPNIGDSVTITIGLEAIRD